MERKHNFTNPGDVSDVHLSNVIAWVREMKNKLEDMEADGETRFLIDGRYWYYEENRWGGADLVSTHRRQEYTVRWKPHDYGQHGGIFMDFRERELFEDLK